MIILDPTIYFLSKYLIFYIFIVQMFIEHPTKYQYGVSIGNTMVKPERIPAPYLAQLML